MYNCAHLHCTYWRTLLFNLNHYSVSSRLSLEGHSAVESSSLKAVQSACSVQRRSLNSALISMETESILLYRNNHTGRVETAAAALQWPFLTMEWFESGAERHALKFDELLDCDNFDIEEVQNEIKSVILECDLPWKSSGGVPENQNFMNGKLRMEKTGYGGVRALYQRRVIDVIERITEMFPLEKTILPRTTKQEGVSPYGYESFRNVERQKTSEDVSHICGLRISKQRSSRTVQLSRSVFSNVFWEYGKETEKLRGHFYISCIQSFWNWVKRITSGWSEMGIV